MTIAWAPDGKRIASGEDENLSQVKSTATVIYTSIAKGGKPLHPQATVEKTDTLLLLLLLLLLVVALCRYGRLLKEVVFLSIMVILME